MVCFASPGMLHGGYSLQIFKEWAGNEKNALIIPQKATFELQDKVYVYVVDTKNKVHSKCISIKQKLSNLYIVESGLTEKDIIILDATKNI